MGYEVCGHICPECDEDIDFWRLRQTVEEVASALENMGREEPSNFDVPQAMRDLCRHQAARLRKALEKRSNG